MDYAKEILSILCEAGAEGLSVQKISMHVHNACNSLFAPIAYDDVRRNVQAWLLRNSKEASSPVVHSNRWGYYAINHKSPYFRVQHLPFGSDGFEDVADSSNVSDTSDESNMLPLLFE